MTAKDQAQPSTPANGDSTPNTPPARGSKPTNPDKSPNAATEPKPVAGKDVAGAKPASSAEPAEPAADRRPSRTGASAAGSTNTGPTPATSENTPTGGSSAGVTQPEPTAAGGTGTSRTRAARKVAGDNAASSASAGRATEAKANSGAKGATPAASARDTAAAEDKATAKDDTTAAGKATAQDGTTGKGNDETAADGIAASEASPDATDVLENAAEPSRRRWRRRAKDSAKLPATRRWDRWYWVVARGLATAAIGVVAILLGTIVLPQFIDTNVSADKRTDEPPAEAGDVPGAPLPSTSPPLGLPTPSGTATPPTQAQTQPGRPADTLSTWAVGLDRLGIPQVALQAYGYAETVLSRTQPSCQLSWTLLAGIGSIESNHGRHGGSVLQANGVSEPRIVGIQLDGSASQKIADTDKGALDGDPAFDRAMGAMQFIPSTWAQWKSDADNDGKQDPYDIDDAALSAAYYLCANGRNLSTGTDWWSAVLSYNNLERYANDVYTKADRYGQDSTAR